MKAFLPMVAVVAMVGLTVTSCAKKEGCTDPDALNYDSEAEEDNGTCDYEACCTLLNVSICESAMPQGYTSWANFVTYAESAGYTCD